jgi:hypothetical protein
MRHSVIFAVAAAGSVWFGCASQGRDAPIHLSVSNDAAVERTTAQRRSVTEAAS